MTTEVMRARSCMLLRKANYCDYDYLNELMRYV